MFCQPLSKVIFRRCRALVDLRALQSQLQCRDFGLVAGVRLEADQLRQLVEEARQPGKIGRPKKTVETGKSLCFKCSIEAVVDDFYLTADRVPSLCKSCELQGAATSRSRLRKTAQSLISGARHRSRAKGKSFDLDIDFILDLILKQQALCAYSGVDLELTAPNSHWRISLERLNNNQGYVRENVALIAREFNSAVQMSSRALVHGSAQWSRQKFERFPVERGFNVDLNNLEKDIQTAAKRPSVRTSTASTANQTDIPSCIVETTLYTDEKSFRCSRCKCWKHSEHFSVEAKSKTGVCSYCRQCASEANLARRQTLRGCSRKLVNDARKRHNFGKWQGEFELDVNVVLDMFWHQRGRCFYSDVPLRSQCNVDWMMSLERLDNTKTYTKDNTRLVALEFNTRAQWSRSKVQFAWGPLFNGESAFLESPQTSSELAGCQMFALHVTG